MPKKITYTDKPLSDIEVVADSLPSLADLVFSEKGVKVTRALSKCSINCFKTVTAKHQTRYQQMIRRFLDLYVEAHVPKAALDVSKRAARKRSALKI
jgi:predicted DNA binding CopG/RHH family protein